MTEKLQKVLANQGFGSRREIERWISLGRIRINKALAKLGDRVSESDNVYLDGRLIKLNGKENNQRKVIIYNKPEGEICTRTDSKGRPTVFDHLPKLSQQRWIMVGRLDINTSGLLLFTTDGDLANRLMHPSHKVEREYLVRIRGEADEDMLNRLRQGVELDDGLARFSDIQRGRGQGLNHWYYVVLLEGRNREVRRLWESQGVMVSRLKRVRYANIFLPSYLARGKCKALPDKEVYGLSQLVDLT